jgi:6-phosphogluconolactonase
MPQMLYVGLQDEDRIAGFAIDETSGGLTARSAVAAAGGPSVFATSRDHRMVYVGHRGQPAISSFHVEPATGALSLAGTTAQPHAPTFLACDRTGKFLLAAYYQGAGVAVYRLAADGTVGAASQQWLATATGAHAIATDRSNRFAFVPHIARLQDNVLEPPKNDPGPNMILQFRFDPQQGQLAPNAPFRLEPPGLLGPRHFCFHPSLDVVYFSNEQGCSVTAYRLDPTSGTLTAMQTAPTLPAGFSGRNTCSQIHLTPSGRFLYVGNRGHNSIAAFAVDAGSGELSLAGHAATEAVPSAFCLDRDGRFLFAAGTASGRLAAYRIDAAAGTLSPLDSYAVGRRPAAVLAVGLSG